LTDVAERQRTETREATRRAVLAYVAALNAHDPDAVAACVTADFVNEHASSLGRGLVGREAYRARLPEFLREFAELRYEPQTVVVDGDLAAVFYRMTATWLGAPPARHAIDLPGVFKLVVRDGLIAHRTDHWDGLDFMRQTGQA
jgi:ketosteroid isomerase-like protein